MTYRFTFAEFREFVFSQPNERRAFTGEDSIRHYPIANAMRHFIRKKFGKSAPMCTSYIGAADSFNIEGDLFVHDDESYLALRSLNFARSDIRWAEGKYSDYKTLKDDILQHDRDRFSRKAEIDLV
jgi:hypothetical protein